MARADSIIRVSIIGDASKLVSAVGKADAATGGLIKSAAKAFLAARVVGEAFDVGGQALDNADRFADALTRIEGTASPELAGRIKDISDDLTDFGLSNVEVAEMAANFTDLATAAGVTQEKIGTILPDLLTLASAIAATTGKTVDEVIVDIGAAARGNQRAVNDYGIVIDTALNPDERLTDILDKLNAKFPDATTAADDFAGAQEEVNAKWETFLTKIGEGLEGPLKDLLDFINDEIDSIDNAIVGFQLLGTAVENFGRTALGPLGNIRDALDGLLDLIGSVGNALNNIGGGGQAGGGDFDTEAALRRQRERNGLPARQGGP